MSNEERTIEDELREAMAATTDDTTATDVVDDAVVETTSDRDENGRFKSKDKAEPVTDAAVEQPPTDEEPAGKNESDEVRLKLKKMQSKISVSLFSLL